MKSLSLMGNLNMSISKDRPLINGPQYGPQITKSVSKLTLLLYEYHKTMKP